MAGLKISREECLGLDVNLRQWYVKRLELQLEYERSNR